jgi:outer membrane protein OmpA-like peptidoglycan-associated protein
MRQSNRVAVATLLAALAGGCDYAGKRTGIGGGAGAAAGAGVGALAGGWKGAAIGAGVGALAGGSVGLYLDKQAKELEQVAETRRTENGLLVQMKSDILFDTDSAVLKPDSVQRLTKVGDVLAKYSDDRVRVEGYTDSTGSAQHNEDLSARRAGAVKAVLVGRGVREGQITSLGMGETKPVGDNNTVAGRALNRRVELHIDVPNPT